MIKMMIYEKGEMGSEREKKIERERRERDRERKGEDDN